MNDKIEKLINFSKEIYYEIKKERGEELSQEDLKILETDEENSLLNVVYIIVQISKLIENEG